MINDGSTNRQYEINHATLSEAIELVIDYRGKTPKKLGGDWSTSGYRALSAKNIKTGSIVQPETIRYVDEELYKKWMKDEVQRGDIFITSEAPFGQIYYWDSDEKIVLSQRIFALRTKKEFCSKYLYYYMTTPEFQAELDARATGTTVIGLRQPELLKCKIKYPPLGGQRKIAGVLGVLDDKIELNNKINNNLEQQAQALFDKYFPLVSTGEINIGKYISPKRGKNLLSKDAVSGKVPVVAGGLFPSTYHNTANTTSPVITISASGANAGYVNLWHIPVWSSDSSFIDSKMTPYVYFWFIMLKKRQKEIFDSQTGSAQPHIYPQHIEVMPISELDMERVKKYNNEITPMFNLIGRNIEENTRLAQLRDTLLPKLMSGVIDVEKVDISALTSTDKLSFRK